MSAPDIQARPHRRCPRPPLGPGPHRLVPVPLGRPATAEHGRRLRHVAPLRRPDLFDRVHGLERREAGQRRRRHRTALDRRDPRTRPASGRRGPSRCDHRRPAPADSVAQAVAMVDEQMAAPRFRGVRPMGASEGSLPPADVLRALQDRGLLFEVMTHPDQLVATAKGLEQHGDLVVVIEHAGWPRNGSDDERALWAAGHRRPCGPWRQRAVQAVRPGHAAGIDGRRRPALRGSSTRSTRSASTAACSRATFPSTGCTAPSTSSTPPTRPSPRASATRPATSCSPPTPSASTAASNYDAGSTWSAPSNTA